MLFSRTRFGSLALLLALFLGFLVPSQSAQAASYSYNVDCNFAYGSNVNTDIFVTLQAGDTVTFTNVTTSGNGFCDNQYTVATLSSYFSSFPTSPFGQTRTFVVKSNPSAITNGRIAIYTSNINMGSSHGRQFYFTIAAAPASYSVTFNANGGTGSMNAQTASSSTALTSNAFTRSGYSFAGWNTAANGSGTAYSNGAIYSFGANVTLFAQWTLLPKTVTFDANGGSGSMSTQSASSATALTANAFTRSGFTFSGWNTAANGSGTAYANSASYSFAADVTLFAQWALVPKTVTFNANGGSGSMSTQSASSTTATTTNAFTRSGFTFSGWNTAANGSGTAYANGASYPFAADVTLFAQWTSNSKTVTFDANGGSGSMSTQSASSATAITANAFTRSGFTFSGWNTAANGSGSAFADLASFNFATDLTLFAQWSPIQGGMQQQVVQPPAVVPAIESIRISTAAGQTCEVTIQSSNFSQTPVLRIGEVSLKHSDDGKGLLRFQLPQGLSGIHNLTLRTADGSYSFDGRIKVPNDCNAAAQLVTSVSGFSPGSAKLTQGMKQRIQRILAARPQLTSVSCTGFTSGPTRLSVDNSLALNRATAVCGYVKQISGGVISTSLKTGVDLRVSVDARRVELILAAGQR